MQDARNVSEHDDVADEVGPSGRCVIRRTERATGADQAGHSLRLQACLFGESAPARIRWNEQELRRVDALEDVHCSSRNEENGDGGEHGFRRH